MTKLCQNCQRPVPSWKRKHAKYCKPSCRVIYYRRLKKQGKTRQESVNGLGSFTIELEVRE